MSVTLVPFDRDYLDRSWEWLQDEETRRLTMTPAFTRGDQLRFFEGLPERLDYRAWGVALEDVGPIGAAGLKHIGDGEAEYWGYIGDKHWWGKGLGRSIVSAVEEKAAVLNLHVLRLKVAEENVRALRLYRQLGYIEEQLGEVISMKKAIGE